jgi:uncharacterized membrane protein YeaQ/YmgE (transglycosylase-associated protein family)
MNERYRVFGMVALLGFMAGIIGQATWQYFIPWLASVLPAMAHIDFLISGFIGACLSLVLVSTWAYITGPTER